MDGQMQFKLEMAEKFLAKIPDKIPKSRRSWQKTEENAEVFLFFAAGAIELVKRQINDKFHVFDSKNVFYIHGLRKSLANSGAQKKTKKVIGNYFTTPKPTDIKKSALWRLQALRNQAMHGNIITSSGKSLVFIYTIHEGKNWQRFEQKSQNPHRYFANIFLHLKKFISEVCKILAKL